MIELRWIVPDKTTTNPPVLQWRHCFAADASGALCGGRWSEWEEVPRVVRAVDSSGEFLEPWK